MHILDLSGLSTLVQKIKTSFAHLTKNNTFSGQNTFHHDLLILKQATKAVNKGVLSFQRQEGYEVGKIGIIISNIDQFSLQAIRGDLILDSTTADINVNHHSIKHVATPVHHSDAANKAYVDAKIIITDQVPTTDTLPPGAIAIKVN